jgi:hypothetical protein
MPPQGRLRLVSSGHRRPALTDVSAILAGELVIRLADQRQASVDAEDIAAVTVEVLLGPDHAAKTYDVTRPTPSPRRPPATPSTTKGHPTTTWQPTRRPTQRSPTSPQDHSANDCWLSGKCRRFAAASAPTSRDGPTVRDRRPSEYAAPAPPVSHGSRAG